MGFSLHSNDFQSMYSTYGFLTHSILSFAINASFMAKSGKPCPRLTASYSFARELITVKMVVPTRGSLEITDGMNNDLVFEKRKIIRYRAKARKDFGT